MSGDVRVLLWDIDGTLIRSARREAFKEYTVPVLEEIFGTAGRLRELSVSGMTDLQIVAEALRDENFTASQIRARLRALRDAYIAALELAACEGAEPLFQLLPGALEILEATDAHPRYLSALLTGNIEPAATLKMKSVGLSRFFKLPGAFGDDSHDRRDLPALAAERIMRQLKVELRPAQFIIIGDTPNDITCARHFGARAVAVGSGRSHTVESLRAYKPDALLPDLIETGVVMQLFDSL